MPRLVNKPELVITQEDDNGHPLSGKCSLCGLFLQVGGLTTENKKTLNEEFKRHVKEKHPRTEHFSQAAATIVREATEDR